MNEPDYVKPPSAPKGTGPAGRRLWRAVVEDWDIDGHHTEMLRAAVKVADLVARCDALVEAEGVVIDSPQGPKAHPALVEGRNQRALLARLVAGLGLPDGDVVPDGRRRGKPRPAYQLHAVGE